MGTAQSKSKNTLFIKVKSSHRTSSAGDSQPIKIDLNPPPRAEKRNESHVNETTTKSARSHTEFQHTASPVIPINKRCNSDTNGPVAASSTSSSPVIPTVPSTQVPIASLEDEVDDDIEEICLCESTSSQSEDNKIVRAPFDKKLPVLGSVQKLPPAGGLPNVVEPPSRTNQGKILDDLKQKGLCEVTGLPKLKGHDKDLREQAIIRDLRMGGVIAPSTCSESGLPDADVTDTGTETDWDSDDQADKNNTDSDASNTATCQATELLAADRVAQRERIMHFVWDLELL